MRKAWKKREADRGRARGVYGEPQPGVYVTLEDLLGERRFIDTDTSVLPNEVSEVGVLLRRQTNGGTLTFKRVEEGVVGVSFLPDPDSGSY